MKKLSIITTFWGRAKLTALFQRYYAQMKLDLLDFGLELNLACAHSPKDPDPCPILPSWTAAEVPNSPLSLKWQMALMAADADSDGYVIMGSDDFCDGAYLLKVASLLSEWQMICPLDIWLWEPPAFKAYHTTPWMVGAGRVIRRDLLEEADYKLWPKPQENKLDGLMWNHLQPYLESCYFYRHDIEDSVIVDIKTPGQNMWSLKSIASKVPHERVSANRDIGSRLLPAYYRALKHVNGVIVPASA